MSYRLPPLNGLKAFEAAARHRSFKRAAAELHVTPAAVSHQVKHLEEALGIPLFERLHRGLVLTAFGESYLPAISAAFDSISEATDGIARSLKGRTLRIGISPVLGSSCGATVAKLVDAAKPGFSVRVSETDDVGALLSGALDALVRPGSGPYPDFRAETIRLADEFGDAREAALIVWPGLAACREIVALKGILGADGDDNRSRPQDRSSPPPARGEGQGGGLN